METSRRALSSAETSATAASAAKADPEPADRYVCWLDRRFDLSPALVGGKAAGLGRLSAAGYPVPPGFVITADAFRAFARHNALEDDLGRVLGGRGPAETAEVVAKRLEAGSFPEDLRTAIARAFETLSQRLHAPLVAVRSSATDEDGRSSSFAGQHATSLNVRGLDAVIDAARRGFASLLASGALEYRRALRSSDALPAMAIIVQAMVPAEVSGVLFTTDPVSGSRDVAVLNVASGLGEALVSGRVTPDHYTIARATLQITSRDVSHVRALSDDHITALTKLGLAIEGLLGAPQDIEWAHLEGRSWILQSRPITGIAENAPGWSSEFDTKADPQTVWTSTNIQEVLPGLLSPLTWSFLREDFERYTREALRRLGLKPAAKDPLVGAFYQRAFLNLTLAQEIGGRTATADKHYLGDEENAQRVKPGALSQLKLAAALPKSLACFARLDRTVSGVDRLAAECERADEEKSNDERSLEDLVALERKMTEVVRVQGAAHVLTSIYSGAMFAILGKLCVQWLGDTNGELQGRLSQGLSGMDSATPAHELWALSRVVLAADMLRRCFSSRDPRAIDRELAALEGPEVELFRRRLREFMSRHGHHSVAEMEIAQRAWEEDPATIFAMIRNYLEAGDERSPAAIESRCKADREEATRDALDRLGFAKRALFRYLLGKSQKWIRTREHTKSLLIRAMNRRRRLIRAIAKHLLDKGRIRDVRDVDHLTWDEVVSLASGAGDRVQLLGVVDRRRIEEKRNRQVELPESFSGRPSPLRAEPVPARGHDGGARLEGIPVSRGTVTGRARVVMDPREEGWIEPGEILVAPITDAGWTPLFTVAAGLVVDIGGALSHGSTVAREYGLPAVVNVKIATRLIRTGDLVTVDGTQGVVWLSPKVQGGG